jgi:hypothetical protein
VRSFLHSSLALVALTSWSATAHALELHLDSAGARGAFSNPLNHARFFQTEAYANWNLPWCWGLGHEWHLRSRLELTGGWMGGRGDNAGFGTLGPGFVLGRGEFPLVIEAGVSPTLIGREQFGHTDFGTIFQFTTHVGLTWHATSRLDVGWRFEHMSNANIGPSNPGVNLYCFSVGWRF